MAIERQRRAIELIHAIKHQYPRIASTKGKCLTPDCKNMARSNTHCAYCLCQELARLIKNPFYAQNFVNQVAALSQAEHQILDTAIELDEKEDLQDGVS